MRADYAKIAFRNLRNRSKRTWLTMLGIFIGIAAVVALISLGQGLQQAIDEQFSAIGGDKIIITGKSPGFGPPGFATAGKVTEDDIKIVKRVNGVLEAGGQLFQGATIDFNDEVVTQFLISLPDDDTFEMLAEFNSFKIEEGRMLKKNDKGKVMLGVDFANNAIYRRPPRVGNKLIVNNETFSIVGIMARTGDPGSDNAVVMMEDDARDVLGIEEEYHIIAARIAKNIEPDTVVEPLKRAMRRDRGQDEGKEDFEVQTAEQLIASFQTIFLVVQVVLIGIAGISLLVGGIGIMNTMYTSVLERTKEIGIMKAIGATNADIMQIFLIESGFLGLAGGVIGVTIGISLSKSVEIISAQALGTFLIQASAPWYLILGSLLFSFLIGTLSGALPARQASQLKPVDALRYE